ncbi:spore coat protein GerQ [Neobacillus ginsengisoli]|uniref:Spore germination protein Q n=1 Tax=Neobacillus ginsengisoli TaxID=904295 RepID=A0ABT9XZL0_9BACI|nr:spore coat protein GerQ [Neobacillus ginsengisoli]MDQ0200921.1 spore germination protein Q [Neobacillus ginsengisoli]
MNQYYNPQGFQPYTGAGGAQPVPGQQAYYPTQPAFPPVSPGAAASKPPSAPISSLPGQLPIEQSYIENILRLNKGKMVTVYATFEGNSQWNAKTFKGIIEAAGRDHVILSDPQTGMRFLIPMVAVDYITFDEQIEYEYPFASAPSLGTYPPR